MRGFARVRNNVSNVVYREIPCVLPIFSNYLSGLRSILGHKATRPFTIVI